MKQNCFTKKYISLTFTPPVLRYNVITIIIDESLWKNNFLLPKKILF